MESNPLNDPLLNNDINSVEHSFETVGPFATELAPQMNELNQLPVPPAESSFINTLSSPSVYIEPTWTVDLPSSHEPQIKEPNRDFSSKPYSDLNLKHPPAPRINPMHLRVLRRIQLSDDMLCSCKVELDNEGKCQNISCDKYQMVVNETKYEEFQKKIAENNIDVMERWDEELNRLSNL